MGRTKKKAATRTTRIIITIDIDHPVGTDPVGVIDRALDSGTIQSAILAADLDSEITLIATATCEAP